MLQADKSSKPEWVKRLLSKAARGTLNPNEAFQLNAWHEAGVDFERPFVSFEAQAQADGSYNIVGTRTDGSTHATVTSLPSAEVANHIANFLTAQAAK